MIFRRKSRMDRMIDTAERMMPSGKTVARAVGVLTGGLALLSAASSGVSALRQKSS
jgi:hypothetical protein